MNRWRLCSRVKTHIGRMADPPLHIRTFDAAVHDVSGFTSGVPALDRWIRGDMGTQVDKGRLHVWCVSRETGPVLGLYGLALHVVEGDLAAGGGDPRRHAPIPAIFLTVLATDVAARGQGLGRALLADALKQSHRVSGAIGAAALVLDVWPNATADRHLAWYTGLGFRPMDPGGSSLRLFLSRTDIGAAL